MLKFFLLNFLFISGLLAQVPELTRPVEDLAQVLNESEKQQIESKIRELHDKKYFQMSVLILDKLPEDEVIESYSIKVAEKWQLGDKDLDNGLLLIISIKDRKMRLEVGNGIEGAVTDVESYRSIDAIKPYLRAGDYKGAILTNIEYLESIVFKNTPEQRALAETALAAKMEKIKQNNDEMLKSFLNFMGYILTFGIIGMGIYYNFQFFGLDSKKTVKSQIEKLEKEYEQHERVLEEKHKEKNFSVDTERLNDYSLKQTYDYKKEMESRLKDNIVFLKQKIKELK